MTEWLGKQILDGFCDSFRQKQGDQAEEGTVQRKTAKELDLTVLKLRVGYC